MKTTLIVGSIAVAALLLGGAWLIAAPQSSDQRTNEIAPQNRSLVVIHAATPATSTPTIGAPTVTPTVITVDTPTTVNVTATITAPTLIPGSVNLLRLNPSNVQPTIVGVMHEEAPGDHIYGLKLTINEAVQGTFEFEVSAAFAGLLRRVLSQPTQFAIINRSGNSLVDLAAPSSAIILGVISQQQTLDDSAGEIVTDLTITVGQVLKGSSAPGTLYVRVLGGILDGAYSFSPGTPLFTNGETVVLLLTGPDSSGFYSIPNLALGVFHVRSSAAFGQVAVVDNGYSDLDGIQVRNAKFQSFLQQSQEGQVTLPELYAALGVSP